jgi:hypothetical protein
MQETRFDGVAKRRTRTDRIEIMNGPESHAFMISIRSVHVSRPAVQAGRRTSAPFVLRFLSSSVCGAAGT